eukprot:GHVP01027204.1.p1 GENE.GHVP01027204.1~~GHVP01027204.1.p1  ORF type:complete len:109 (+),score=23.05 GHVP01027204.1:144-470(+)
MFFICFSTEDVYSLILAKLAENPSLWYLRAGSTEIFHLLTEPSNLNLSEYAIEEAPALFEISVSLAASYFGQLSELPILFSGQQNSINIKLLHLPYLSQKNFQRQLSC